LIYIQKRSVEVWNENLLKETKIGKTQFVLVEDFLAELKREFEERDNKPTKVAKLKKIEQDGKTIEEFMQKFNMIVRENRLEKEFKRRISRIMRRKLMKA